MANSGVSYSGGRPRCFAYFQEFQKCYSVADYPSQCSKRAEDYIECLHHRKELERQSAVYKEYNKQRRKAIEEGKKATEIKDSIIGLGLISRTAGGGDSDGGGQAEHKS